MEKATVQFYKHTGSSYQIGYQLGKRAVSYPNFVNLQKNDKEMFSDGQMSQMNEMFNRYCPGLSDELQGFADAVGVSPNQLYYYAGTYLVPGCSLLAVLPGRTKDGHMLVARNYEFSHKMDDLSFGKTHVDGRYAHIGSSSMLFGRSEGINECGLMVGQTSCGLPVGNFAPMRKSAVTGLQFWAAIRSLLENCKDVDEALEAALDMPVAYNINLLMADKTGKAVLLESYDGVKDWKMIDAASDGQYLHSTNHAHLPRIMQLSLMAMEHSAHRYALIRKYMEERNELTVADLKSLLLTEYPNGLCCRWYEEFFGTVRSMVFDVTAGAVELCWGGLAENGWTAYTLEQDLPLQSSEIHIKIEHPTFDFCKLV